MSLQPLQTCCATACLLSAHFSRPIPNLITGSCYWAQTLIMAHLQLIRPPAVPHARPSTPLAPPLAPRPPRRAAGAPIRLFEPRPASSDAGGAGRPAPKRRALGPEAQPAQEQSFPDDDDDNEIPIEIQEFVGRKVLENQGSVLPLLACACLCSRAGRASQTTYHMRACCQGRHTLGPDHDVHQGGRADREQDRAVQELHRRPAAGDAAAAHRDGGHVRVKPWQLRGALLPAPCITVLQQLGQQLHMCSAVCVLRQHLSG